MPAGSKSRRVPGTDGACGWEPQWQPREEDGQQGDRRQVLLSKISFLEEREPLEGQHQAGKEPQPARGLDTEGEVLISPVRAFHHEALLRCVVPLLVGATLWGLALGQAQVPQTATLAEWSCHPGRCPGTRGNCKVKSASLGQENSIGANILAPPEMAPNHTHSKIQLLRPVGSRTGQKLPLHFFTQAGAVVPVLSQGCCSRHRAAKWSSQPQETSLAPERAAQSTTRQSFQIHDITGSQIFSPQEPGETNRPPQVLWLHPVLEPRLP